MPAPAFELMGTDGRTWSLDSCRGPNGLLVMFICVHCPYVQAVNEKLVRDATDLLTLGVNSVAIMPNDTSYYYFSDGQVHRYLHAVRESHRIRPMCDAPSAETVQ